MEKNITKVLPKTDAPPPDNGAGSDHEEKASSSVPPEKIHEISSEKLSHNLEKETGNVLSSKAEPGVAAEEDDDEEFILRLHSSDEETFEDAMEMVGDVKKPTSVELPEKYFSDIESSDDSEVYEPKSPAVVDGPRGDVVPDSVETEGKVGDLKEATSSDEVKGIELELEPVESDEDDFEESPSLGALAVLPSEVESVSDEVEEELISTSPVNDKDKEPIAKEKDVEEKETENVEEPHQEQEVVEENANVSDKEEDQEEVDQIEPFAENDVDKKKKSIDEDPVEAQLKLLSSPVSSQASDFEIDCAPIEIGKDTLTIPDILKYIDEGPVSTTLAKNKTKTDGGEKNKKIIIAVEEKQEDSEAEAKVSAKRKALLDDWEDELSNSPKRNKDDDFLAVITEELNELPEDLGLSVEDEQLELTLESAGADIETPVKEDECVKSGGPSPEVRDTAKLTEETTGPEDEFVFDIETGAELEVETVSEVSLTEKQIEEEAASEEIVHEDKVTSSEELVVPERAEKSDDMVKEIADSEKLQESVEESSDEPLKSALTDDEKPPTVAEEVEEVSIKKAEGDLKNLKESSVKPDDKHLPDSSDATETSEVIDKAKEVVENPCVVDVPQEDKPSEESTPIEKSEESLPKDDADKVVNDLTEERQCLETEEKPVSKEEDPVELATSTEKVSDVAEKSEERTDESTEVAEPQKDAESEKPVELTENNEKSKSIEPDEPLKSDKEAVDSSVKDTLPGAETEISDALKETVDEPKLADTSAVTADVAPDPEPMVSNSTTEPMKNKSSEPEVIEVDSNDVVSKESEKKKVDIQTNEKANSEEEKSAKEAEGDLKTEDVGASKKAIQSKEDKQQLEAVTDMETEAATVAKPSEGSAKTSTTAQEPTKINDDVEMLEIIEPVPLPTSDDQNSKDDTTMKPSESVTVLDDEEPLLMIDLAHKEENEYNDIDTETEQTATSAQTTDSSSDGSLEIFYDKECVNYDCKHTSKNFYRATLFSLNYYKISKKRSKAQFACEECYDRALDSYEEMCRTLKQKQPLLNGATFKAQEYVEIIDSSDEEESDGTAEKFKDENALPKESIEMLEAELEGAIRKVMHNVEIQNQLSWTKQILQQRLNNLEEDAEYVSEQLRVLQKKTDNMHNSLYQCPKIKIRQLTPLDLNSGRTYYPETENTIPPVGEILRPSIYLNETYYAVKNKAIASWVPCKVLEEIEGYIPHSKNLKHYKIKFLKSKYPMLKTVSAKHMAFFNPPKVRLPIGTRVIAYFDATSLSRGKEKMQIPSAFYPGIIAEPLKQNNKFRYLVFYDDGYFQYVYHKDVRLVCSASEQVWEDVHHQSREFIHNYLTQYAVNRPMVQTQKGQSMLVDYNGKWIYARVIDVDCSLVQMLYEGQSRSEWIYRGSTRLGPVYKESNNLVKNHWGQSRLSRRTEPFIRYFNGDDSSSSSSQQQQQQQQIQEQPPQQPKPGEVRSVAKKSVSRTDTSHSSSSQPVPAVRHLNNSTIFVDDDNKPKGKVVYYTARKNLPPRDYVSHICSPSCQFTITHNLLYYSPLAKPLLSGWERQVFRQKSKKFIVYRGPCGKRMRSMEELHRYLRVTENDLNVDNFDFSPETNCLAEYVIESCIVQKKDISNGMEKMPIPCVNYYDNTMPPDCVYSSRRIPTEGVPLNLNKEFLVGCDCEDDCSDKSKCSCWELTYAGAKYGMPNVPNEMVGYQYKRLYEHVPTGIYECNSRCKCKANCINRVVQQPLQSKLQVFKTSNRGWGLRCINDVPRGSFICIYAGHLLTEQKANEGGLDAGDEYFAELDYIEVAEQIKEGYESDVVEPDEDEELYNPEKEDDDDDEFVAPSELHRNKAFNTRLRTRRTTKNSTDAEHDSQERQVISFEPNKHIGQPDHSSSEKQTIRKLFGKDEACYIMDAKITGNLGRYFNHSCSPNLFVQNVFVDTHDLRFPWVAFFAFTHIRAGTELTWNYNYEVGVVPGKVLYCQCGAPNCRQRLL